MLKSIMTLVHDGFTIKF